MVNNLLVSGAVVADSIIIAVVAIFALTGLIRGFVASLIKYLGGFMSLVLAFLLCAGCARLLNDLFGMTDAIARGMGGLLGKIFKPELLDLTLDEFKTDTSVADGGLLPRFAINLLLRLADAGADGAAITVRDALAPTFAYYVAIVIGFVVCYILVRILFFVIGRALDKFISKIRIVSSTDKILGMVFGLLAGLIFCFVVLSIIAILPFGFLNPVKKAIEEAAIARFVSRFNVFALLFGGGNPLDYVAKALGK